MKVILTPQGGVKNPYINLLVNALQQAGAEVNLAQSHRFILWQAIRDYGWPDVFHIQWLHPHFLASNYRKAIIHGFIFYLQVIVFRLLGVRFVWTVHNIVNHEKDQMRWDLFNRKLMSRLVHRLVVHCPSAVSLVSEMYNIAPSKIGVAPMGNFEGYYASAGNSDEARQLLGLPKDAIVYLFIGHIRPYKGINSLIDAFEKLNLEEARLVIAGRVKDPELKKQLLMRVKNNLSIHPHLEFIADEELASFLQAADYIVLPYTDILTSSTAVLAMSFGRPVILPRVGCVQDLSREVAIHYDPNQSDGLQLAMEKVDTALTSVMGKAAQEYSQTIPWSLTAEKMINIYQSTDRKTYVGTVLAENEK